MNSKKTGAIMIACAVAAFLFLSWCNAYAVPIELDPCVTEKTLITRKPAASPGKTSPIIAWVTVRSGGPINPDAPKCTDELVLFDLPEPEFVSWLPDAPLPDAPVYEEPPVEVWPLLPYWPTRLLFYGGAPRRHVPPPQYTPPPKDPVPPVQVPETDTLSLFLGALFFGAFLYTRRQK